MGEHLSSPPSSGDDTDGTIDLSRSTLQQVTTESSFDAGMTLDGLLLLGEPNFWKGLLNDEQWERLKSASGVVPSKLAGLAFTPYFGAREIILTDESAPILNTLLNDHGSMLPSDNDWYELQIPRGVVDDYPLLVTNGIGKTELKQLGARIRAKLRHLLEIIDPKDPSSHLELQTGRWHQPLSEMDADQVSKWIERFVEFESQAMVHELIVAACLEQPTATHLSQLTDEYLESIATRLDQLGDLLEAELETSDYDFADLMSDVTQLAEYWIACIHQARGECAPGKTHNLELTKNLLSRLPSPRR